MCRSVNCVSLNSTYRPTDQLFLILTSSMQCTVTVIFCFYFLCYHQQHQTSRNCKKICSSNSATNNVTSWKYLNENIKLSCWLLVSGHVFFRRIIIITSDRRSWLEKNHFIENVMCVPFFCFMYSYLF